MHLLRRALIALYLFPAVVVAVVLATAPASPSGYCYAAGGLLLTIASTLPRRRARRVSAGLALLLVIGVAATRVVSAGQGRGLRMSTPGSAAPRVVNRLFDEQDLAVNGARALQWTGFVRDPDVPGLAAIMRTAYARMREAEGATPSPVIATYTGLETPGAADTIEVGDVSRGAGVIIFLHGYAGSFTLPCWVVSQAASDAGFATVCPATRWVGDWWSTAGEATLRQTVADLRQRGVKRFVLAGLSNGGLGASLLAPRFPGTFDGVVLISGASDAAPSPGVPVLVIQGERDTQITSAGPRAYARRVGGRYLSLDAGHFALLVREGQVRAAIAGFLRGQSSRREIARHGP